MTRFIVAVLLALSAVSALHAAAATPAATRRASAALPAANFIVEWRIQPAGARPAAHGDVVITSGSAATGTSGFGAGAVVVGTARAASPQSLRVANGKEGSVLFDRSETRTVYDMAWAASTSASAGTDGTTQVVAGAASSVTTGGGSRSTSRSRESGVQSHEEVTHRVDGLRVTPRWAGGDALELDVALTHSAPAGASRRDIDVHSVVRASFDEWLTVASVGDGGDELQVRVTWR